MKSPTQRFAHCIAASKRVRWDIETDVIRGRQFDLATKFLPDGLTLASSLPFLAPEEKTLFQPGSGPHLRQHVRPGRTLYQRQGP